MVIPKAMLPRSRGVLYIDIHVYKIFTADNGHTRVWNQKIGTHNFGHTEIILKQNIMFIIVNIINIKHNFYF